MKSREYLWDAITLSAIAIPALIFATCPVAGAHSWEIIHCANNFKVTEATYLWESTAPNGLLAEAYDTDAMGPLDGRPDIVTFSSITGWTPQGEVVEHREHPLLYEVDFDGDQNPDATYIDRYGVGNCNDIYLYKNHRNPQEGWPNYNNPPAGKTVG